MGLEDFLCPMCRASPVGDRGTLKPDANIAIITARYEEAQFAREWNLVHKRAPGRHTGMALWALATHYEHGMGVSRAARRNRMFVFSFLDFVSFPTPPHMWALGECGEANEIGLRAIHPMFDGLHGPCLCQASRKTKASRFICSCMLNHADVDVVDAASLFTQSLS